jgi:hypothetical protein
MESTRNCSIRRSDNGTGRSAGRGGVEMEVSPRYNTGMVRPARPSMARAA